MKFESLAENPTRFSIGEERGYERMRIDEEESEPCTICAEPCAWLSVCFGEFICSHECVEQAWGIYFKNLKEEVERQGRVEREESNIESELCSILKEEEIGMQLKEIRGRRMVH